MTDEIKIVYSDQCIAVLNMWLVLKVLTWKKEVIFTHSFIVFCVTHWLNQCMLVFTSTCMLNCLMCFDKKRCWDQWSDLISDEGKGETDGAGGNQDKPQSG